MLRPSEAFELPVPEVRRCLALLRKRWAASQSDPTSRPAYLTDDVGGDRPMSAAEFALAFVMAHHAKRGR